MRRYTSDTLGPNFTYRVPAVLGIRESNIINVYMQKHYSYKPDLDFRVNSNSNARNLLAWCVVLGCATDETPHRT